ncbi:MAG: AzlD domain-containing protein [Casimicrobiaceae bacterium]
MVSTLTLWTVIVVVGALNYLSRLSFIALFARRTMPAMLARALKYVPAAMLTALVLPMVFVSTPTFASLLSPRVIAALVAGAIGFFTRNTLATVVVGMGTLWLLQAIPG